VLPLYETRQDLSLLTAHRWQRFKYSALFIIIPSKTQKTTFLFSQMPPNIKKKEPELQTKTIQQNTTNLQLQMPFFLLLYLLAVVSRPYFKYLPQCGQKAMGISS
jgi:hypothetical protein